MKFIPLTPQCAPQWDLIAYASNDAWLFHLYDWIDLERATWNWVDMSFLVEHEGQFIAIVPLQMNKSNRVLKSDIMGASGPALINGLDDSFRHKVLKAIYEHIEAIALNNKSPKVDIYLTPLSDACLQDRWQVNPLINFYYTDLSAHTLLVDLSLTEELIDANLSKDARFQLRKAKEAGYSIQQAHNIDHFYTIHCANYQRTGAKPHPKSYFLNIFERLAKKGHAFLWEALDKEGKPIAYEIIAIFKHKAFYWSGCCATKHLNSGVNYLLQVHSMLWAKSQGAVWFETGEAYPHIREGKEKGLTMFKEKFGGNLHRLWLGRLELNKAATHNRGFRNWIRANLSFMR